VRFLLGANLTKIVSTGRGSILEIEQGGAVRNSAVEEILIAAGREPNISGLGLDSAGITHTSAGIATDDRGRTNVRHIYALGGATGAVSHTHMAEYDAKVAVNHALTKSPAKFEPAFDTWLTMTDPELAHIGTTEAQLKESGSDYQLFRFPFERIDRAVADSRTDGMIKILATKSSGKILGVNILGRGAGDQIGYFALAMRHGLTMRQLADTVLPYPTYSTGIHNAANEWSATQLGEGFSRLVQKAFGLKSDLP
jgi:pyruvate/2-oxoglutarate dehydrogenase complex dihydrolipoamide dehydrogenase (E3) component